jgi:putative endonuclease
MTWSVYLLQCADGSLYAGITTDVERRIHEHNHDDKKAARYTRSRRPIELIYSEAHDCRSTASKRESAIKQLTRRQKLALVASAHGE